MKVLIGIFLAWAVAWGVVVAAAPALWIVAALGFLQNVAFTFVSRGRNSGSLVYHMVASIFSNGIWLGMFVIGVKIAAEAPTFPAAFAAVYVLSTMAGSVFAHWLARKVEKGKARNVQEDRVELLEKAVRRLEEGAGFVENQDYREMDEAVKRIERGENELVRHVGHLLRDVSNLQAGAKVAAETREFLEEQVRAHTSILKGAVPCPPGRVPVIHGEEGTIVIARGEVGEVAIELGKPIAKDVADALGFPFVEGDVVALDRSRGPNPLFLETVMRKLATLELLVKGREGTTLPERLDALEEAMRENVRQEGATSARLGERLEKVEEKVRHLWTAATYRASYPETGSDLEGRIAWLEAERLGDKLSAVRDRVARNERNVARLGDIDIRGTVKMHLQPILKRIAELKAEIEETEEELRNHERHYHD